MAGVQMKQQKTWVEDEEKRVSVAFMLIAVIMMLALIGVLSIVGLMIYLIF